MSASSVQAILHQDPFEFGEIPPPPAIRTPAHDLSTSVSSQHTNPFQTLIYSPHTSDLSVNRNPMVFSPVSPLDANDVDSAFRQPQLQPRPNTNPNSTAIMSSDLRRSDAGARAPPEDEANQKPRKVKVAEDMYAGEMPPGYDVSDYQGPLANKEGHRVACNKCGGNKKISGENKAGSSEKTQLQSQQAAPASDCHKCGGRKSNPPSSYPRAAMATAQPRPQPQVAYRTAPVESSDAGPSGHRHKCGKCGRHRRPESVSTIASSSVGSSQPGLHIQNLVPQIQTNGVPVTVNIEPPTAITERAPTLPFSPASTKGETPLIANHEGSSANNANNNRGYKKSHSPSRSGSMSSLFRSLSRRKKSAEVPLSSPQPVKAGEQTQHNRQGSSTDSRLRPNDYVDRPGSPFSFMGKVEEEQSFEMGDMQKPKQPERRNSWEHADESTKFLNEASTTTRPTYSRSQSTRTGQKDPYKDDIFLSLPPDQRPGVTRFKSLRTGVNRAANGLSRSASQISRSTSLKRLESVKKVPQFWYRDDMAIEGASSEYNTYAY